MEQNIFLVSLSHAGWWWWRKHSGNTLETQWKHSGKTVRSEHPQTGAKYAPILIQFFFVSLSHAGWWRRRGQCGLLRVPADGRPICVHAAVRARAGVCFASSCVLHQHFVCCGCAFLTFSCIWRVGCLASTCCVHVLCMCRLTTCACLRLMQM